MAVPTCYEHVNAAFERRGALVSQLPAGTAEASDDEGRDLRVFLLSRCILLDFDAEHRS